MRVDLFDFELPDDLIALRPVQPRDAARLLVAGPGNSLEDRRVSDLPDLLREGDVLVLNDTKVIPAELRGERSRGGSSVWVSATLTKRVSLDRWRALMRPGKRLMPGDRIRFGSASDAACLLSGLDAKVEEKGEGGEVLLSFDLAGPYLDEAVQALGHIPLPPYIAARRAEDERDRRDYQTIYAREEGAVAAPTAGLHFTDELFARLGAAGINRDLVTLHVGPGTFLPVKVEDTDAHVMHSEWGSVSEETAEGLNEVRRQGGRIVAVGTTSLRLLESAADAHGVIRPFHGETSIFITPGYRFRAVDLVMTNFHLPRSTLFMLVSAFAGYDRMKAVYRHAIDDGYRFYSYGDASLLYPGELV